MTLIPRWWIRPPFPPKMPSEDRIFQISPDTGLLAKCHWQHTPEDQPTILMIHGLEGCTESHYMRGLARKMWESGWNCVRLNQRNCGGSEHLTPTLYHNGLSQDLAFIIKELAEKDNCHSIWLVGYSMGGNLSLKVAGESQSILPALTGVVVVCPNIHPAACVMALQHPSNWIYHQYFLRSLKSKLRRKAQLFPNTWDLTHLHGIRTMWEFDNVYTAPDGGFRDAPDYYEQSAARNVLEHISCPTLIITAQDDPFVPFSIFGEQTLTKNSAIQLLAPRNGGHCGFLQQPQPHEDRFWAENRVVEFIRFHENR